MALIRCPECEKEISDKAAVCPSCGYPISEHMERIKYDEEVSRLTGKIEQMEYTVPEPRMKVCIKCGEAWWYAPRGRFHDVPRCKCSCCGKPYPFVEVDYPANEEGHMGALLYVQQHFIEPLKIGDIESDEYKRRVQAMFDRIASCDEFRKSQGFSGKITPEPPEVYLSAQNDNPEVSVDFSLEKVSAQNVPQCPICGSTNLSKITVGRKAVKIGVLGVFGMGDTGKTWRCNNCGSKF